MLLVFVPGLALALGLGMRGWYAVAVAPLLTFAVVLVAIVVAGMVDVRWGPAVFGATAVALALVVLAAAALWRRRATAAPDRPDRTEDRSGRTWSALAGLGTAVGAGIGFLTVVGGTGGLTDPNQGFDALFHVNLIETITRSGDVSPSVAGRLNGYPDGTSVYPDAFHAMASLIAQLSGGTLAAINALMACIPLIGGVGLLGLLRSCGLVREAAVVPVVLAASSGYPVDLIWRGPVWVFVFGITLVPAFLVLLRWVLDHRSPTSVGVMGIAAAGLAVIHPSAALSAAVFALCLLGFRWASSRAAMPRDLIVLVPAGVLAAALTLPLIGQAIVDTGGGTVVDWPAVQSAGEVVGELLFYNYDNLYPQLWLAVPTLVGAVVAWRAGALRWWIVGTGVFLALCVLAAAYEGRLVQLSTGPWWNDRFRFAGLVFLGLAVLGAVGVVAFADALASVLRPLLRRSGVASSSVRGRASVAAVVLVVALIGVLSGGFYVQQNQERLRIAYGLGVGGAVSSADLEAFDVLHELPGTELVLNDPNDGSSWMWALADVEPVFGAALTMPVRPPLPVDRQILIDGLNCLDSDEEVRRAIEQLGVRHVYSSESPLVAGPTPNEGFRDLASVESLRPIYQRGGATIFEIDLVALQDTPDEACRVS